MVGAALCVCVLLVLFGVCVWVGLGFSLCWFRVCGCAVFGGVIVCVWIVVCVGVGLLLVLLSVFVLLVLFVFWCCGCCWCCVGVLCCWSCVVLVL